MKLLKPVNRTRYIPALTGLRAIAAYLVFLHHYNPAQPGTFAHRLLDQGYTGVSVFFILSGFLIYHRYANAYLTQQNWSWWRYLQNRFARIFPLYALLLIATVSIRTLQGHPMSLLVFGLNLSLLKGFFEDVKFTGIAQSWSLTVELSFYGLAPLLFTGLQRWGMFRLTIGLVSIGLFIWATPGQLAGCGFFGSLPFVLFYTFFGRAFEFVLGMWLACCWHQGLQSKPRVATLYGIAIISVCVSWQANVTSFTMNPTNLLWSEVIVYNCLLPAGIGLIFLDLLSEKSSFRYALSRPVVQALGRSSYAFYLIHSGVLASGLQRMGITNTWLLFGLLILLAHGLYVFVEKPLHRLLLNNFR